MTDNINGILKRSPIIEGKEIQAAGLMSIPDKKFIDDLLTYSKKNVVDFFVEISPVQLPNNAGIVMQKGQTAVSLMMSVVIFFQEK